MASVGTQIHGYRRGHELLAASLTLPKTEQSVVDRLSDVAGPLRPSERFSPYLTGYPLPGGSHYVLARTWQDLDAPRAGCVRTRSLLVPATEWADARSLVPYVDALDASGFPEGDEASAADVVLDRPTKPLPPAPAFRAEDLLEALFLEDPKPVAVFDAPDAELIALRLLTALWPAMRARFSFSTFARSPRRIEGRFFDLVFAPKDARSKFSDWPGRRVDGRAEQTARHRWTDAIIRRVFEEAEPRLMSAEDIAVVGSQGAETPSALRVALLWWELGGKLEKSPTAALGMLDIANSRNLWETAALRTLDPAIASATRRAVDTLAEDEAWDFVGALARKVHGRPLRVGRQELERAAAILAARAPEGAVALASQPDADGVATALVPAMSSGLASHFTGRTSETLSAARPDVLGRLVAASDTLSARAAEDPGLIARLGEVWSSLDPQLEADLRRRILPLVHQDRQLPLLAPILHNLDRSGLLAEIRHLAEVGGLDAQSFFTPIVQRAREVNAVGAVRDELVGQFASESRDGFLFATLTPVPADLAWLAGEGRLDRDLAARWMLTLLRAADRDGFSAAFRDEAAREAILRILPSSATDVMQRVLSEAGLPLGIHVRLLLGVLPGLASGEWRQIVGGTLDRCLREGFGGDEVGTIAKLVDAIGSDVDPGWLIWTALKRGVPTQVVSRNLRAFARIGLTARGRVVAAIGELARALDARYAMDLDGGAIDAFAALLGEAAKSNPGAALEAAGRILPLLMRSRREPVSGLVAVAFPMVYRELAKKDEVPDLLKFVPFFDWDRCKTARQELVYAFMASSWAPGDLARTACLCQDVGKILRRAAKAFDGDAYIARIASDLSRLDGQCRSKVERTISNIRSDWSSKFDWRD